MKILIYLAFLGTTLIGLSKAQDVNCTADEIELLSIKFSSCTNNASCFLDLCGCCAEALNVGISDSRYDCCFAYSSLLQCEVSTVPVCDDCVLANVNSGSGITFETPKATTCYCLPGVAETPVSTGSTATTTEPSATTPSPTSGKDGTRADGVTVTLVVCGVVTLLHVLSW